MLRSGALSIELRLKGLRKLSASYNALTQLPEDIGECQLLEKIRVVNNQITDSWHLLLLFFLIFCYWWPFWSVFYVRFAWAVAVGEMTMAQISGDATQSPAAVEAKRWLVGGAPGRWQSIDPAKPPSKQWAKLRTVGCCGFWKWNTFLLELKQLQV